MTRSIPIPTTVFAIFLTLFGSVTALAEGPAVGNSRWGPDDELGTLNHITPEKIIQSAGLVRQGKVFSLQLPLDCQGPQTGAFGRINSVHQMVATGTDHAEGAQDYPLGFGVADDTLFVPVVLRLKHEPPSVEEHIATPSVQVEFRADRN